MIESKRPVQTLERLNWPNHTCLNRKTDMADAIISHSRLLHLLSYAPESGLFTWKNPTSKRVMVGDVTGCPSDNGYLKIRLDGTLYLAHRLAWFYVYAQWPTAHIDHRNRIRSDNRIANLREATRVQNMANMSMLRTNTSGTTGVTWDKRHAVWKAFIGTKVLGSFPEKSDAVAARLSAQQEINGEYTRVDQ